MIIKTKTWQSCSTTQKSRFMKRISFGFAIRFLLVKQYVKYVKKSYQQLLRLVPKLCIIYFTFLMIIYLVKVHKENTFKIQNRNSSLIYFLSIAFIDKWTKISEICSKNRTIISNNKIPDLEQELHLGTKTHH